MAGLDFLDLIFQRSDDQQSLVPATLQFAGDETVVGIDGVILAPGESCFVARLLERQVDLPPLLRLLLEFRRDRIQGSLHAERLEQPDDLAADRLVHPKTAERDAAFDAMVHEGALAVVAASFARCAAISDMQLASAVAAPQQTGQQDLAAAHRAADQHALTIGVIRKLALVPLNSAHER